MFALIEYTKHDKLKKHRNTQNTNFKCTGLRRSLRATLTMLNMYFNLSWLFKNYLSILVCRRPKIIWSVKLIQRCISLEQVYFKIVIFLFERVFLPSLIEQKYHNMALYWSVGDWSICCRMATRTIFQHVNVFYSYLKEMLVAGMRPWRNYCCEKLKKILC